MSECGLRTPSDLEAARREAHAGLSRRRAPGSRAGKPRRRTRGLEGEALVEQPPVRLRDLRLELPLLLRQHELLELRVRGDQRERRGRFEDDAPLGAQDRVAEVDAAPGGVAAVRRAFSLSTSAIGSAGFPSSATGRPSSNPR